MQAFGPSSIVRGGLTVAAIVALASVPDAQAPTVNATSHPAGGAGLMIEVVAGSGTDSVTSGDGVAAAQATIGHPGGIAFDAAGHLYFSDPNNSRVRKVDAQSGVLTTVAGNGQEGFGLMAPAGDGGPATATALWRPQGLAFDSAGDLYIAEAFRVRKVSMTTGIISTVAGTGDGGFSGDGGPATAAQISGAGSLAFDGAGNLYIADRSNARVRRVAAGTGTIDTIAGSGRMCSRATPGPVTGDALAVCLNPWALAFDPAGRLYILDLNERGNIRRMDPASGTIAMFAGDGVNTVEAEGDGFPATDTATGGSGGLAIDGDGNVYFTTGNAVRRISAVTGRISTLAGRPDSVGGNSMGGPALNARLFPNLVAVDGVGNVYVDGHVQILRLRPNAHDVPHAADMDGDGRMDLVVWRPGNGTWYWLPSSAGYADGAARSVQWGRADLGDLSLTADMDGDGKADPVIWRASTGTWYWLRSSAAYSLAAPGSVQWGSAALGDTPLLGDVDGDGRADLIIWRSSTGTWHWITSSTGYAYASAGARQWGSGVLGDAPLVGDVDGDGKVDLVVRRKDRAFTADAWFCLTSGSGYTRDRQFYFGVALQGDLPLLADMDGDRRVDIVTWNRPSGVWRWIGSRTDGQGGPGQVTWGNQAFVDQAVLGDADGDGRADPTVWRQSTGTWYWLGAAPGQKRWGQ